MSDPRAHGLLQLHSLGLWLLLIGLFIIQSLGVPLVTGSELPWASAHFWYVLALTLSALFFTRLSEKEGLLPARHSLAGWLKLTLYQSGLLGLFLLALALSADEVPLGQFFLIRYYFSAVFVLGLANRFLPLILARFCYKGGYLEVCVLMGSVKSSQPLLSWAELESQLGRIVIGLLTEDTPDTASGIPIIGKPADLPFILKHYGVHQVILLENKEATVVHQLKVFCEQAGVRFSLYNAWQAHFKEPLVLLTELGQPFFTLQEEPLESPFCRMLKRTFDIVFSLLIVLFIIPPLALLVWFFQQWQAPGPLFYRQERTGLSGHVFLLFKFRSMRVEVPGESMASGKRVFPFGRFIRRASLDELPQFINVFLGHMSVVGPRPHWTVEEPLFSEFAPAYRQRHWVKPGITGLAQAKGLRGEVCEPAPMRQRVAWDFYYLTHWSPYLDVEIIVLTALQVLFPPPGAR